MLYVGIILMGIGLIIAVISIGCFANAKKWADETAGFKDYIKFGIICVLIALVLLGASIAIFISENILGVFGVLFEKPSPKPKASGGTSSKSNYYDNYDYDNDGEINQNEWEDALGDYMDDIMK